MIIDFHTHIFPEKLAEKTIKTLEDKGGSKAFTNGTLDGLKNAMKAAGLDCSIILPVVTKPEQFKSVNEFAVRVNEQYGNDENTKLLSFGGIHPDSSDYKSELRQIVHMGLRGIKLHPDYQETMFDDMKYMRIIDYASDLNLIISVHAGLDIGYPDHIHCTPKAIRKVLDQVSPDKLILAHFGGYRCWNEVEEYIMGQKVFLDTAFIHNTINQDQFLRIMRQHGCDKVLFATDSPWSDQSEVITWLKNLQLSQMELERIFFKNALDLLVL